MWIGLAVDRAPWGHYLAEVAFESPASPEARVAMASVRKWLRLSDLIGTPMPMTQIVGLVRTFSRMEGVFTLARIAAELANSDGGVLGDEARSWTHDLLVQRVGSSNVLEDAVSRALRDGGHQDAIAHGRVIYTLMQMVLAHSPKEAPPPKDGMLAFLMLAINDHIPRWEDATLSATEESLGALCAESIFNRSFEDPLRFIVRLEAVFSDPPTSGPVSPDDWEKLHQAAFGCSFGEYLESYLAPLLVLSRGWDSESAPILFKEPWQRSNSSALYEEWFRAASVDEDVASAASAGSLFDDGLARPSRPFLETPFIETENRLLAISPWHIRDHASLGTWGKLNAAAKKVFGTKTGNQQFTAAFGYLFEQWCQRLAQEAVADPRCPDRVIIAETPGTEDEVEDVVVVDGSFVALISAKAGLVPADRLKAARSLEEIISWLTRFFIEDGTPAKGRGYRPGALRLLDQKVQNLRDGKYEPQGIPRDATVLPVIVTFDHMPGGSMLLKWLGDRTADLGLFGSPGVRPVTLLNPPEFEALFALASRGHGVCRLLDRKAQSPNHLSPTDWFLTSVTTERLEMRLPSMEAAFNAITQRTISRLRELGVIQERPDQEPEVESG